MVTRNGPPPPLLVAIAILWAALITVAVVLDQREKHAQARCELSGRHVVEAQHGDGWSCLP
jgi:hypothetical protein